MSKRIKLIFVSLKDKYSIPMNMTKSQLNDLVYQVIGAAIEVHKELGPGLLESVYHKCMEEELQQKGINFESEKKVSVKYKNKLINTDLRCDLVVEDILIVELKAVEKIIPIHEAQILTYMNLLKIPKGILINFNSTNIFKFGQKTFVNDLYRQLP
jgi:GxxExxY protein